MKIILEVSGKKYNASSCSYDLHQAADYKGRPAAEIMGGNIDLTITGLVDDGGEKSMLEDSSLLSWKTNSNAKKEGKVTFEEGETELSIEFKGAFLTRYGVAANSFDHDPISVQIEIAAKQLKIGGIDFNKAAA